MLKTFGTVVGIAALSFVAVIFVIWAYSSSSSVKMLLAKVSPAKIPPFQFLKWPPETFANGTQATVFSIKSIVDDVTIISIKVNRGNCNTAALSKPYTAADFVRDNRGKITNLEVEEMMRMPPLQPSTNDRLVAELGAKGNPQLPTRIKYGDKIGFVYACDIMELVVGADSGDWTFNSTN